MNSSIQEKNSIWFHIFARRKGNSATSDISNSYAFKHNDKWYLIDTSCGRERYRQLRDFTRNNRISAILCTHYHNDHISNNGRIASGDTPIIYHHRAKSKVKYLRTNSTGQVLMMYNKLDKYNFLRSLGFFSKGATGFILKYRITTELMKPVLFILAYVLSLKTTGRIYTGRKRISYLEPDSQKDFVKRLFRYKSWEIAPGLYAFETPGHTNCHVAYCIPDKKTLFCGDALNFLNPNDIQFGSIADCLNSQKVILELVKNLDINILCMGHYEPVTGKKAIMNYINDIINKHEHVLKLISGYIRTGSEGKKFNEIYKGITSIDDDTIRRLAKITFPRSTLVFLDVYLLKMLSELEINYRK